MQKPVTEHLTPDQFAEWIAVDIEARRKGGPNLQDKYLELVAQLPEEVRREYKELTIKLWSNVEGELAKPKPTSKTINGRRYSVEDLERNQQKGEASFSVPATQPPAEEKPKDTSAKEVEDLGYKGQFR